METITYKWGIGTSNHTLELVYVPGTSGAPYAFGNGDAVRSIELPGFFIQTTPVTQALSIHVLGADANPSIHQGVDFPVENVSWESITRPGGFLDRINQSVVRQAISHRAAVSSCAFRLSTETETNFPTLNALALLASRRSIPRLTPLVTGVTSASDLYFAWENLRGFVLGDAPRLGF